MTSGNDRSPSILRAVAARHEAVKTIIESDLRRKAVPRIIMTAICVRALARDPSEWMLHSKALKGGPVPAHLPVNRLDRSRFSLSRSLFRAATNLLRRPQPREQSLTVGRHEPARSPITTAFSPASYCCCCYFPVSPTAVSQFCSVYSYVNTSA